MTAPGSWPIWTSCIAHAGRSTVVIEVRIERVREGERKVAANLIVTQFVIPPDDPSLRASLA